MKKITVKIALLLSALFLVGSFGFHVGAEETIAVYVDGKAVTFDAQPRIIENRTMVPMRAIFEAIGASVSWDPETRTVGSSFRDTTVSVTIGTEKLIKNGTEIFLDVPAQVVESRTLVPVRAVAESFDCKVEWIPEKRAVRIVTSNLDSFALDSDREVYATVKDRNFSKAFYDVFASDGSVTDEEIAEYFRILTAYEQYAAQKGYTLDFTAYDTFDKNLRSEIDAGTITQSTGAGEPTILVRRTVGRDAMLAQYVKYLAAYDAIGDTESLLPYIRENAIRVKHILVKTEEEAETIEKRLADGDNFESLITEYSIDGMNPVTGYIFGKGEMVEEFETAAYALKLGETSAPVKSQFGYHIIRRYDFDGMTDEEILSATGEGFLNTYCADKLNKEITEIAEKLTVTYSTAA